MAIHAGTTDQVNDEQSDRKTEDGCLHAAWILASDEAANEQLTTVGVDFEYEIMPQVLATPRYGFPQVNGS